MDEQDLCLALGVDAKTLRKYIRQGLPYAAEGKKKIFDDGAVAAWLVKNGLASQVQAASTGGERHVCEWLLRISPRVLDPEAIRALVGGEVVQTIREVAKAFGVSHHTVRVNWRGSGMPGQASLWPLAEIAIWRLGRDDDEDTRRGDEQFSIDVDLKREKLRHEVTKAAAAARIATFEAQQQMGNFVAVEDVRRVVGQALTLVSREMQAIPKAIMPSLPKEDASEMADRIGRKIKLVLHSTADKLQRKLTGMEPGAADADHDQPHS